jgi:FkbH-like protein
MTQHSRCLLVSDFNLRSFANYLEADDEPPSITATSGPFGLVEPLLIDPEAESWSPRPEAVVVWTRPQAVVPAFVEVLAFRPVDMQTLLAQVDSFASLVAMAAERSRLVLVPSWVAPFAERGWGMLDLRPGRGIGAALAQMNVRLAERLAAHANIFVLDTQRWLLAAGKNDNAHKLWFIGKVPFANEVLAEAARDVRAAIAALRGESRKLVLLDLDDTIWGGILGDVGWENLILGGHHHSGEAYVEFQRALKALTARGIVLGIVSKNTEAVALEAIRRHPEMQLGIDDFAGWRINWDDKAQNIINLTRELNLGLESVVYLDDNRVERARVREALPEVYVPEWPADPMLFARTLRSLRCFDVLLTTDEDAARARMYSDGLRRGAELRNAGGMEEWLRGLETTVTVEKFGKANLGRIVQLLNKTNQMNLRTRRLTERELKDWIAERGNSLWSFRVADRLGDSGLTGIASLAIEGSQGFVTDYVLSCRVMGRKIEETLLAWLVREARRLGAKRLTAEFLVTAKNQPCLDFMRRSGFDQGECGRFTWDTDKDYPIPGVVRVVTRGR